MNFVDCSEQIQVLQRDFEPGFSGKCDHIFSDRLDRRGGSNIDEKNHYVLIIFARGGKIQNVDGVFQTEIGNCGNKADLI
jgi:hypothetical protein